MLRRALGLGAVLVAACAGPAPTPPVAPTSAVVAGVAPTPAAVGVAPAPPAAPPPAPAPPAAAPESEVPGAAESAAGDAVGTAVAGSTAAAGVATAMVGATAAEAGATALAVALAVTAAPPPATPTAIALDARNSADETRALASGTAGPSAAGGPTAVVLPPSARLPVALLPTANVLASSPSLAGGGPAASVDYTGAIKLVQESRKGAGGARLSERLDGIIARARSAGSEVEVQGWQAALKGSADVYQVTFALRENRQGLRAEWEANLTTGAVRPANPLAEALEAS